MKKVIIPIDKIKYHNGRLILPTYGAESSGGGGGGGTIPTNILQLLDAKIDKVNGATNDNIVVFGTGRTIKDSKKSLSDYLEKLTSYTPYSSKGSATKVPVITTNSLGLVTDISEAEITSVDVTNKEDKFTIVGTHKTSGFEASVKNYYFVDIAASSSVSIQLATPTEKTKLSSCVFFLTTNTSPALDFAAETDVPVYYAANYKIEANKVYEINALYNGSSWCIAQVEMEVQS